MSRPDAADHGAAADEPTPSEPVAQEPVEAPVAEPVAAPVAAPVEALVEEEPADQEPTTAEKAADDATDDATEDFPEEDDAETPRRPDLETGYRRLLLAYPKDYRAIRGLEMLTTLLDGSRADQARPTPQETKDLLVGGVRYRLRLPSKWLVVLAVLVTFAATAAGAAAGAWLGWRTAGDLPNNAETRQIATTAFGPRWHGTVDRRDVLFDFDPPIRSKVEWVIVPIVGRTDYGPGWVEVSDNRGWLLAHLIAVRERLAAAGWRIGPIREAATGGEFVAAKDDLVLRAATSQGIVLLSIQRGEPGAVAPLTFLGGLFGAVAAWLGTASAVRRGRRDRAIIRSLCMVLAGGGAMGLIPVSMVTLAGIVAGWVGDEDSMPSAAWSAYMFLPLRPMSLLGALAIAVAAGLVGHLAPPQPATIS